MIADNRDELVDWLTALGACFTAIRYVESLPADHGLDKVWALCSRGQWLSWLSDCLDMPYEVWYQCNTDWDAWCCCKISTRVLANRIRKHTSGLTIGCLAERRDIGPWRRLQHTSKTITR